MLAQRQASLRLNVVWISCPSYILSSFLGAKIELIFDTSKEKRIKVYIWAFFCLFVRHRNRHVRQKTANELDTLDKRGYTLPITFFLLNYILILHLQTWNSCLGKRTEFERLQDLQVLIDLMLQRDTGNENRFPNHILTEWFLCKFLICYVRWTLASSEAHFDSG